MRHNVELLTSGIRYGGWKSIRVMRGLEQIAGSFELSVSERWPNQLAQRAIRDGEACQVLIDGQSLITGYVDDVLPSYDDSKHEVTVQGRDRTADLVDCSALHAGQWRNRTLTQIAADLCAPYGVTVKADVDIGAAFATFKLNDSETVFEVLDRAARLRGVLLVSDGQGGLIITRAATSRIADVLERGRNILAASATLSTRERYRTYVVKGQTWGSDETSATDHSARKYTAQDTQVGRQRTLILLAEDQADTAACARRAIWERNTRAGKSRRAVITVAGWAHGGGLWQPNTQVRVRDTWLGIDDADLLIVSVTFIVDDLGTRTELTLMQREAFDVLRLRDKGTIW